MAFCTGCGNDLAETAKFCPRCGTAAAGAAGASTQAPPSSSYAPEPLDYKIEGDNLQIARVKLKPGQEIKFNNPPAAGGYREYKMTELQGIMAGIGLPRAENRAG